MKKDRPKKQKSIWSERRKWVVCLFVLYLLAGALLPYVTHKSVSDEYAATFDCSSYYSDTPGTERVRYISDNTDALIYRLKLLEEAQEEILFSTFDFDCDQAGLDMMAALLAAADRGVEVKMLIDGISGLTDVTFSRWFAALASHENVELRLYNPVNPLTPWHLG